MERMLVVVFEDEIKAYEASRALQSLDDENVIGVFGIAVVKKNREGASTAIKTHYVGPQNTIAATAVGSLLGLLGGPVGVAVGAASGLVAGAANDKAKLRVASDFVTEVRNALTPGKTAVVAEIDEESTGAVDERMEVYGGTIFRRALSSVNAE